MPLLTKYSTPEAYQLLHEGGLALAQCEHNGMRVDELYLNKAILDTGARLDVLSFEIKNDDVYKAWKQMYGNTMNLDSGDQLAWILFHEMGLKYEKIGAPTKDWPDGKPSVDAGVLTSLDLPFPKKLLKIRQLSKIKNTFLAGIKREVISGFLHPNFNNHLTITYRTSSDHPNFQNFPARDKELSEIVRRCFIPREGRLIVESDFSGIEVRIAYCYHKDPVMKVYLEDKTKDMHRDMAMQLYCIADPKEIEKTARNCAKGAFVFAEFYGDYYIHSAKNLWGYIDSLSLKTKSGTSLKEVLLASGIDRLGECDPKREPEPGTFEYHVKEVEDDFWNRRFRVYGQWKKDWYAQYLRNGGWETKTGYVVKGIYSKNDSINHPVQGDASNCLVWSLIEIQKETKKQKMEALTIGTIHDSLVSDVPEPEIPDYLSMVKEVMTDRLPKAWPWITIPLEVEQEVSPVGGSWFDKREWAQDEEGWSLK